MEKRYKSELISRRPNDNLVKLSGRQDSPLRIEFPDNIARLNEVELSKFVLDVLSLVLKHPVRDKFIDEYFVADVDI